MSQDIIPVNDSDGEYQTVLGYVVQLVDGARRAAARSVNAVMTATYWQIGRRLVEVEQGGQERAAYGEHLLPNLARDLTWQFGRGLSCQNLQQMRQFFLTWQIRQTLSGESDWEALAA